MITPAPGFWPIFGPPGPTAGPGSHGNGPGSKNSAGCTKSQPRRPIIGPSRGYFVFWDRPQKDKNMNDKCETPQGLPGRQVPRTGPVGKRAFREVVVSMSSPGRTRLLSLDARF